MPLITPEEILTQEVRALNWKQPYAELMLHGKQETRTWPTKYRGLVLIVASALPYADREILEISGPEQYARILQTLGNKWFNQVKRQSAIAVGRLVSCYSGYLQPTLEDFEEQVKAFENQTFVKHNGRLFTHHYADVTAIKPFPWRGTQGWRTLSEDQKKQIQLL